MPASIGIRECMTRKLTTCYAYILFVIFPDRLNFTFEIFLENLVDVLCTPKVCCWLLLVR